MTNDILIISKDEALKIIKKGSPRGLYITKEGCIWVAIDNMAGNAWVEDFLTKEEAINYLKRS